MIFFLQQMLQTSTAPLWHHDTLTGQYQIFNKKPILARDIAVALVLTCTAYQWILVADISDVNDPSIFLLIYAYIIWAMEPKKCKRDETVSTRIKVKCWPFITYRILASQCSPLCIVTVSTRIKKVTSSLSELKTSILPCLVGIWLVRTRSFEITK